MERRVLLVFALTFLILMVGQPLLVKLGVLKPPAPQQQQQQQTQQAQPTPQAPASVSAAPTAVSTAQAKQASSETESVIENDLYRIVFTNKGAQVKSWVLKKYTDDHGNPQELVNPYAAPRYGYPLSLWTYDAGLRDKLNSVLYVPTVQGVQAAPAEVSFEYADGDVSVRKTFRFDHSYVVRVDTAVTRGGANVNAYPAWPGSFGDQKVPQSYAMQEIDFRTGEKIIRLKPDKKGKELSGGNTVRTPFYYAGPVSQYFSAIFLPDDPSAASLVTLRNSIEIPEKPNNPDSKKVLVEVLGAAVGNAFGPTSQRVYVGPNSVDALEAVKASAMQGQGGPPPDLGGVVDFGWFGIIAKPLFLWLKWTQQHMIPNWGWAIAFLTVVINLALLPLRISQMKSSLKMQRLQPQMNAIRDKYKKYAMRDPRRAQMNQEVAALYKEHGVNPIGGCLPLLLQFPFLVAFYKMLTVAIELRHAKWLWVSDLAAPDPYYILPVSIIIFTVIMQRMTPMAGMDPAQQRMMNIMMPVMLGLFAWSVAAGLALYWLVGTVIAIVVQMAMNRTSMGREMRDMMEKRARKQQAR